MYGGHEHGHEEKKLRCNTDQGKKNTGATKTKLKISEEKKSVEQF